MIANHIVKTGSATISGCSYLVYPNNLAASYAMENIYVNSEERTGANTIYASMNTQTVLERTPSTTQNAFGTFYSGDGDFYSETGSFGKLIFSDIDFTNWQDKNLYYDIRSGVEAAKGESSDTGTMQTLLRQDITGHLPAYTGAGLVNLDFFLNGQKIYSGTSGSYSLAGNLFNYLENVTGQLFAVPKKPLIYESTGTSPDLFGTRFVEGNTDLFINGMEQPPDSWMELSTGVSMISTGITCKHTYDFSETLDFEL